MFVMARVSTKAKDGVLIVTVTGRVRRVTVKVNTIPAWTVTATTMIVNMIVSVARVMALVTVNGVKVTVALM